MHECFVSVLYSERMYSIAVLLVSVSSAVSLSCPSLSGLLSVHG